MDKPLAYSQSLSVMGFPVNKNHHTPGETANELFNLLAAREGKGSTMVTSQFSPEDWYESMPDRVVAESLLNRLVGGAEIVNIEGTNMRLKPTVST